MVLIHIGLELKLKVIKAKPMRINEERYRDSPTIWNKASYHEI